MEVYYPDGHRETVEGPSKSRLAFLANLMEPGSGLPADTPPAEVRTAPDMSKERVRVLVAAASAEAIARS